MSDPAPRAADSREAILDAAERLFAKSGFAATTIKAIAKEAGVNSALLYYYYADKEALYRAVLEREMRLLASEGMRRIQAQIQSPPRAIRALIDAQLSVLLARPHLPRLVVRELVDHEASHAAPVIAEVMAGLFARLCDVIRAGQHAGAFRKDVDPRHAAISIVSQLVYFFVARPAVSILLNGGRDGLSDDDARVFGEHAADFALAALASRGNTAKETQP